MRPPALGIGRTIAFGLAGALSYVYLLIRRRAAVAVAPFPVLNSLRAVLGRGRGKILPLVLGSLLLATQMARAAMAAVPGTITDDFSTDSGLWTYQGSAYRDTANGYVVLTQNVDFQSGIIWFKQAITSQFTVEFNYKAGGGTGADGIFFMFYKNVDGAPGYAIEFDNYQNPLDPSGNHIALTKDGTHLKYVNDSRTEDNQWHRAKVAVSDSSVEVFVDGNSLFSWAGTIDRTYGGFGFLGATGAANNWHIIDDINLNRPPVLDPIGNKAVDEGQLLSFTILATDPDGDPLSYSAANLPLGATFNATTRAFSWTPSHDQAGTYVVTFTVSDSSLSDSETITITVNNVVLPTPTPTPAPTPTPTPTPTSAPAKRLRSAPDPATGALILSGSAVIGLYAALSRWRRGRRVP